MNAPQKNQLAVALHYEKPGTPRVVAKGKGELGQRIIETAKAHGVPIEENAGLAGALSEVEIGDDIPVELYKAVAEVLLFIMKVSGRLNDYKPQ
jgi:flagellar biosynthesis protein